MWLQDAPRQLVVAVDTDEALSRAVHVTRDLVSHVDDWYARWSVDKARFPSVKGVGHDCQR